MTHDCSALQDATNDPNPSGYDDNALASDLIREATDNEGTDERTGGHGCDDGTLGVRARVPERVLVGVVL